MHAKAESGQPDLGRPDPRFRRFRLESARSRLSTRASDKRVRDKEEKERKSTPIRGLISQRAAEQAEEQTTELPRRKREKRKETRRKRCGGGGGRGGEGGDGGEGGWKTRERAGEEERNSEGPCGVSRDIKSYYVYAMPPPKYSLLRYRVLMELL